MRVDGVLSDIAERKQAEDLVRASEERYRRLFDGNPHAMWIYDADSLRLLAVNDAEAAKVLEPFCPQPVPNQPARNP